MPRMSERAPLYRKYRKQFRPQPAFIEIDLEECTLTADYNPDPGGAVPEKVCTAGRSGSRSPPTWRRKRLSASWRTRGPRSSLRRFASTRR